MRAYLDRDDYITDIFIPFLVLIKLLLGASRAVNLLPTHINSSKNVFRLTQCLRLGKWIASLGGGALRNRKTRFELVCVIRQRIRSP